MRRLIFFLVCVLREYLAYRPTLCNILCMLRGTPRKEEKEEAGMFCIVQVRTHFCVCVQRSIPANCCNVIIDRNVVLFFILFWTLYLQGRWLSLKKHYSWMNSKNLTATIAYTGRQDLYPVANALRFLPLFSCILFHILRLKTPF
jgi:hypothetical protein